MNSPVTREAVLDRLGQELQDALVEAVDVARADLATYRAEHPDWHTSFSKRYIKNFLHERVWQQLVKRLDGDPRCYVVDAEPKRSITWDGALVMRVKAHSESDLIQNYPTDGARSFYTVNVPMDGLELVPLSVGYRWLEDEGQVGPAVIAYRESLTAVPIWAVRLERDPVTAVIRPHAIDDAREVAQLDLSDIFQAEDDAEEA